MAKRKKKKSQVSGQRSGVVDHGAPSSVHLGEETVPPGRVGHPNTEVRDLEATAPKRKAAAKRKRK